MNTAISWRSSSLVLKSLVLLVALFGVEQSSCSGTAANSEAGGSSAVGGNAAAGSGTLGGTHATGGTHDAGGNTSTTGGRTATGGSANSGGNGGGAGVCASGCTVQSTSAGTFCGTTPVMLQCTSYVSAQHAIMTANGCWDPGTDLQRYCCPAAILNQCL